MSWTGNATPHGTSGDWKPVEDCPLFACAKCGKAGGIEYSVWDSSDGAYTDYHYRCKCGNDWWVDGDDG